MGVVNWISQNLSETLQNIGIVSGFWFTVYSIRKDAVERRIGNALTITQHHHSMWKELYDRESLARILEKDVPLDAEPITHQEHLFVTSLILHLDIARRATEANMFINLEGLPKDIEAFFSLPIPNAVWKKLRPLQDEDFVRFVESRGATLKRNRFFWSGRRR